MAVCGQPPVSTPTTRSGGKRAPAHEKLGVLLRVDVVGDDRHVELGGQPPAERFGQRGLARADGPTDADLQRSWDRAHDLNSLMSSAA